jgi:hypothetical protein
MDDIKKLERHLTQLEKKVEKISDKKIYGSDRTVGSMLLPEIIKLKESLAALKMPQL